MTADPASKIASFSLEVTETAILTDPREVDVDESVGLRDRLGARRVVAIF